MVWCGVEWGWCARTTCTITDMVIVVVVVVVTIVVVSARLLFKTQVVVAVETTASRERASGIHCAFVHHVSTYGNIT